MGYYLVSHTKNNLIMKDFMFDDDYSSLYDLGGIHDPKIYEEIKGDLESEFSEDEEETGWDTYSDDQYYDEDEVEGEDELV